MNREARESVRGKMSFLAPCSPTKLPLLSTACSSHPHDAGYERTPFRVQGWGEEPSEVGRAANSRAQRAEWYAGQDSDKQRPSPVAPHERC